MIAPLDNKKNVGIILMVSGIFLLASALHGLLTGNDLDTVQTSIANLIMGEVIVLVGFGIYRQRPYAHFINLFEDCRTNIGVLCSISAGFGFAYLIDGIFAMALKDSLNIAGNILTGLALLISPFLILNYKGRLAARIAHVAICIFATLVLLFALFISFAEAWEGNIPSMLECISHAILMFVLMVYAYDRRVMKEIWGTGGTSEAEGEAA